MTKREAELIERFVENSLDENETRELHTLIQTRSEMIDEIADAMIMIGLARRTHDRRERSARLQRILRAALAEGTFPGHTERRVMSAIRTAQTRQRFWIRFIPLATAAGLLVALGIGLWLNQAGSAPRGIVARVESVQGSVFSVQDIAPQRQALKAGDEIREGTRIETGEDGAVKLAWLAEATAVEVAENSKLVTRNSKLAFLRQGRLTAVVASQPPGNPFAVETPHALATVLGTRFRLEVRGETGHPTLDARGPTPDSQQSTIKNQQSTIPSTWLHVEEGLVRYMRLADQKSLDVTAGRFAVVGEDDAAFALKTYPRDVQWVDGPVIFRDDFEQGLDGWKIFLSQKQPDGGFREIATAPEDKAHVRIRAEAGRTPGSSALEMHHVFGPDRLIIAQPANGLQVKSAAVEFDIQPLTSFGIDAFRLSAEAPIQTLRVSAANKKKVQDILNRRQWYTWRLESRVHIGADGRKALEGKSMHDGILFHHFRCDPIETYAFTLSQRLGHVLIDNYVIRELIPVETP